MVVLENPTSDLLATGVGLVQDVAATTPLTVDTTGAVAPQHHQTSSGGCLSATYPIPTTAAAGQRHQLKMVPKRFINMHQWFNPIGVKQIKEAMVCVYCFTPLPKSSTTFRSQSNLNNIPLANFWIIQHLNNTKYRTFHQFFEINFI